ncbi:hypothetical protein HO173_007569 [Letharia columbiana]|uniref:Uncharacterized protein n=1 Tax=Letharia columbiana TaxID=112416 RepID=A0A8H6FT07_9LECA|nr:uncharacterized protein HO173_007569 [Letharia columbiana]KAF6234149.1 hypothetical protein HO173_007569 [Letharia columbiana]
MQEEDNNDSGGEWSRATYSDASRSSSPKSIAPPSSSSLKRKAETSLDASIDQKESRKGTKRRKTRADEVAVSRLRSTIMALPPNIEAIRQTLFDVREEVRWTAEEFAQLWPFMDNFWVCNKPNNPITKSGTQSSYWWCRLHKGATESDNAGYDVSKLQAPTNPAKVSVDSEDEG